MLVNPWVKANGKHTVDHILREDNFTRYWNEANADIEKEQPAPINTNQRGEIQFRQ